MAETLKILIGDTELVEMYRRVLQREGYQIKIASGKDGLTSLYKLDNFDAAVIDLRIPNSLEIITELRAIPILALSGDPEKESLALNHGASYFLRKPFENGIQDLGPGIVKAMARKAQSKFKAIA